jgi:hypothetical protein
MSLLCLPRICSPNQSGSHDIAGNNDRYQLQLTQAMAYSIIAWETTSLFLSYLIKTPSLYYPSWNATFKTFENEKYLALSFKTIYLY